MMLLPLLLGLRPCAAAPPTSPEWPELRWEGPGAAGGYVAAAKPPPPPPTPPPRLEGGDCEGTECSNSAPWCGAAGTNCEVAIGTCGLLETMYGDGCCGGTA